MRWPSEWKNDGLCRTQSAVTVLPQWRSSTSMKVLHRKGLQHTCFKIILKKDNVLVWAAKKKKLSSTSGLQGLQRCSSWIAYTITSSGCSIFRIEFWWMRVSMRHSVDAMSWKLSPPINAPNSLWMQLLKRKRLFSRVHVSSFFSLELQRKARTGKDTSNNTCQNSGFLRICRTLPSAASEPPVKGAPVCAITHTSFRLTKL